MYEGMGVPSKPVVKRVYISFTVLPPLYRQPWVRFRGRIGRSQSSLSVGVDGPFPRPFSPWHSQHLALLSFFGGAPLGADLG
jgi:hypothetical protein